MLSFCIMSHRCDTTKLLGTLVFLPQWPQGQLLPILNMTVHLSQSTHCAVSDVVLRSGSTKAKHRLTVHTGFQDYWQTCHIWGWSVSKQYFISSHWSCMHQHQHIGDVFPCLESTFPNDLFFIVLFYFVCPLFMTPFQYPLLQKVLRPIYLHKKLHYKLKLRPFFKTWYKKRELTFSIMLLCCYELLLAWNRTSLYCAKLKGTIELGFLAYWDFLCFLFQFNVSGLLTVTKGEVLHTKFQGHESVFFFFHRKIKFWMNLYSLWTEMNL